MKDILFQVRKIHGMIHEKIQQIQNYLEFRKYIKSKCDGNRCFVLYSPLYSNTGDSAIVLAEKLFLETSGINPKCIREITMDEHAKYGKLIKKTITPNDLLCLIGGGNFGDQWMVDENLRREVIQFWKNNNIIMFPQTMYFSDTENGKKELEKSIAIYNRNNLTLVAREKISYILMKKYYPKANIILTPDIVLSMSVEKFEINNLFVKSDVLLCMRNDKEKYVTDDMLIGIDDFLQSIGIKTKRIDMYANNTINRDNRKKIVCLKMIEFEKARLVITDRLHGMIFSAITGTPCIVFSNNHHKVKGTYDWISYLPYIKFAKSVDDVKRYVPELLSMENCKYDDIPLLPYFEKLGKIIKESYIN